MYFILLLLLLLLLLLFLIWANFGSNLGTFWKIDPTHAETTFSSLLGVIHIPRGWFCYPGWWHIPVRSFELSTLLLLRRPIIILNMQKISSLNLVSQLQSFKQAIWSPNMIIAGKLGIVLFAFSWLCFLWMEIFVLVFDYCLSSLFKHN